MHKSIPPHLFDIIFNEGISRIGSLIDVGVELEIIHKSGAFLKFGQTMLGQGKEAAKAFLKENNKVRKELFESLWKAYKAGQMKEKVVGKENAD